MQGVEHEYAWHSTRSVIFGHFGYLVKWDVWEVLGSDSLPKQGGDKADKDEIHKEEPQAKQNIIDQHEEKLKIDVQKGEKLVRKKRDRELDNPLHLCKEEELSKGEKLEKVTIETQKMIEKAPLSDYDVNHMLFSFYVKYRKPQFLTWSLKKIVAIKVYASIATENFINVKFKGFRGASRFEDEFTLADLPCMNHFDWFSLFLIVSKDEQKYEPIVAYPKWMLVCYIHEITKMDVEITYVLRKMLILKPEEE
ncbi:unnamed protein product [Lactuca saligna]|uniref:Uncharacterized protein n=1 Tax=Lactuca saligna TaxID=75948 RepID=A0AA36DUS8_LACSI|nr:unnamed protein product [Lactuca saligna]